MGWLSLFKHKSAEPSRSAPSVEVGDSVEQARTRARQRLIGAVVLVVAGVIGFSLLFETQPRPLPVNTPIEIARRDLAEPAPSRGRVPATPSVVPRGVVINESAADAGTEVSAAEPRPAEVKPSAAKPVEPKPTEPKPVAAVKPPEKPPEKPADKPVDKPADRSAEKKAAEAQRAQAALDGRASAKAHDKKPEPEGRFIVQVGAFADAAGAREARQRVEKLGLKTYTQVVETASGSRIRVRVGPFASKAEADRAAAKLKSAGLSPATYTL